MSIVVVIQFRYVLLVLWGKDKFYDGGYGVIVVFSVKCGSVNLENVVGVS